jgi:hypothetical protein
MVLPVFFFASASSVPPEMLPTPVAPTPVASDKRILRMRSAKSALEVRAAAGNDSEARRFLPAHLPDDPHVISVPHTAGSRS